MTKTIQRWLESKKRKIERRLAEVEGGRDPRGPGPEIAARSIRYEAAVRTQAIAAGGIGAMHMLARKLGLVEALDTRLSILKRRRPYSEADHVLNIAYNALAGGHVLDDIEVRRKDVAFLDALGARTIPDPTTAGDFCRRFDFGHIHALMDILNDGVWGYQPLMLTLANTGEVLYIMNRGANRPSHEGAPAYFDRAIALCRRGGWKDILLRGDTAFSQTAYIDRWDDEGVRFVFGYDAVKAMVGRAQDVEPSEYTELVRKADDLFAGTSRAKQPRVKEAIVREREYPNMRLEREDVADFEHTPSKAKRAYRFVVLRKTIVEERGQRCLGEVHRYFFYLTNDRSMSCEEIVREANGRCGQENLIAELKNGVRALRAPLNTLEANWAYMVIASLACSLKAWFAMLIPVAPRWRSRHQADKNRVLRMDFRTFVQRLMLVPAQFLRTGRQLVYRFHAWRPDMPIFFRLLDAL